MAKQLKMVAMPKVAKMVTKADPQPNIPPAPRVKVPNNKKSGLPMLPQYRKPKPPK
jgi:hypothetical protein